MCSNCKLFKLIVAALISAAPLLPAYAFDVNQAVDEISMDPLTAYTVYLGMPKSDFGLNFSVLKDWTYTPGSTKEKAERSTMINNKTVTEGLDVLSENANKASRIIEFNDYFLTADKGIAKNLYKRTVSTIWMTMEMPLKQSDDDVTWIKNDVTIVVSMRYDKNERVYRVNVRRFNNRVLS